MLAFPLFSKPQITDPDAARSPTRTLRPPWPTFGSVRFKMTSGAMGAKVKFGFCAVTLNLDPPIKYVPPGMNISKQPRGYNSAVSIRFGSVEIIVKTTLLN